MKLVDCFMFFNEMSLLALRLKENFDIVDYFIIVESNLTFSGNNKEYLFEKNKDLYTQYLSKIIHVKVENTPYTTNPWEREIYQRDCILHGLHQINLNSNDIVLVSDCDEIVDNNILKYIKINGINKTIYALNMDVYYYNFTCKANEEWSSKVKIFYYDLIKNKNLTPTVIRYIHASIFPIRAGWHFTFFGNTENIKEKIKAFSHQEYNTEQFNNENHILTCKNNLKDIFNRNIELNFIPLEKNDFLPKSLTE